MVRFKFHGTLVVGDGILPVPPLHPSGNPAGSGDIGVPTGEGQVRLGEVGIDGKRCLEHIADLSPEALAKRRHGANRLSVSANSVGGLEMRLGVGRIGAHGLLAHPNRAVDDFVAVVLLGCQPR